MSENAMKDKGLFETLEEKAIAFCSDGINKTSINEYSFGPHDDEYKFEFLVQDMFLDHFFP